MSVPKALKPSRPTLALRMARRVAVDPLTSCHNWTGFIKPNGYGQISDGKRVRLTHRVAYEVARGPIPDGFCVCHRCDNRRCVNPNHLFLGTQSDNIRDMFAKGRNRDQRGAAGPRAKLTSEAVLAIRESTATQLEIARQFGVHQVTVGRIRTGITWKTEKSNAR